MSEVSTFSVVELLRDGREIEVRALRPSDQDDMLAAADRASDQSLYRRFFGVRREFTEEEVASFVNVDFIDQVALVAVMRERAHNVIAGGARYMVVGPRAAELAFTVVDEFQGQGIGSMLMCHLAALARAAGITRLVAEVLPDNIAMLKVFDRSGLEPEIKREGGLVHVTLRLV
jgi:ribosomal protein S18 acetylase RimI-like enzyme